MMGLGNPVHLAFLMVVLMLLFGAKRLPEMGRSLGSGLAGYFREGITSEGSNSLKPQKEIFEYAFRKAGADPAESIMIGDSIEADIQGAINAGIDQVYVNHLGVAPSVKPTYTVGSLKELEMIF